MEATAGKSLLDVLMHKERQAESPCLLSNTRAKIPPKESSPYAPELAVAITPAPQPIHRKDTTPVMPKPKTPVAPIQHLQAKSDARLQMDLSSPLKVATQESPQFQPPPKSAKKMSLPYSSTNILAQNHQSGKRDMNSPSDILELQSHEISPTTADHLEIKNARTSNDSINESDMELVDNAMRDDITASQAILTNSNSLQATSCAPPSAALFA
ncbi:hypothetical protein BDR26DRAFT_552927 [Obelidium mucronatum]|nr:hypothetical protein BDR26DRAFT_552927 [Obelidium mucronatum]